MKNIIQFLICCLFSVSLCAQNWAPFKNQEVTQFVTLPVLNSNRIQSVVIDSSYQNITVFKKGYALSKTWNALFPTSTRLKGKILGDSLFFYTDSSVFKTIDTNGFTLNFPHRYVTGNSWNLGVSTSNRIEATVDSVGTGMIPSYGIDSIAYIHLSIYDNSGNLNTSHQFHNAELRISKTYGIIKTIDFTELGERINFGLFRYPDSLNVEISKSENFNLTVNDEYHVLFDSLNNTAHTLEKRKFKIIVDTLVGSIRRLSIRREVERRYSSNHFNGQYVTTYRIDTIRRDIDTNQIFTNRYSGIVDNPPSGNQTRWDNLYNFIIRNNQLYPVIAFENNLGITATSVFQSWSPPGGTGGGGGGWNLNAHIIGLYRNFRYSSGNGGSFITAITDTVAYVKKGNQTWSTPLNFKVGISENKVQSPSLSIYPNPANHQLIIQTEQKISFTEVFNIQGKLVKSFGSEKQLDVSALQAGIYFIKINTGKGVFTQKFIKQ